MLHFHPEQQHDCSSPFPTFAHPSPAPPRCSPASPSLAGTQRSPGSVWRLQGKTVQDQECHGSCNACATHTQTVPSLTPVKRFWVGKSTGQVYLWILGWMDPKQFHGLLTRVHSLGAMLPLRSTAYWELCLGGTAQTLHEKGPRFNQLGSQGDKDLFQRPWRTTTCWSWLYWATRKGDLIHAEFHGGQGVEDILH